MDFQSYTELFITNNYVISVMKVIQASPELPSMTDAEISKFLQSKLNMHLATIDENGLPNVHPVWFYYDGSMMHVLTGKPSKKMANIRKNHNVYFCIDDGNFPPKGVKGKGLAGISEDIPSNISMFEQIYTKYLGTLDSPMAKMRRGYVENGNAIILEITPKYFSTWDLSKI